MKKIIIFIVLLFLIACTNREFNRNKNIEKEKLEIEKISSIENIIININLDKDLFRKNLKIKLDNRMKEDKIIQNLNIKNLLLDNFKNIETKEEFIKFIKSMYKKNNSLLLTQKESEAFISEVLVDIYKERIINDLKKIEKYKSIQDEFLAIYIIPNNDFTTINVLLAVSNIKFN